MVEPLLAHMKVLASIPSTTGEEDPKFRIAWIT